jgi:hypothetical protein
LRLLILRELTSDLVQGIAVTHSTVEILYRADEIAVKLASLDRTERIIDLSLQGPR